MSLQTQLMVWLLLARELRELREKLVVAEAQETKCVMQQQATAHVTIAMATKMIATCFTADKILLPAKRNQLAAQDHLQ